MHADYVCGLWFEYRKQAVDQTVHPDDRMFTTAVNGMDDYMGVGISAAQMIYSSLNFAPTHRVSRVLDFGCGYGRVARHIRAMFPEATLFVADIEEAAVQFCAARFNGKG